MISNFTDRARAQSRRLGGMVLAVLFLLGGAAPSARGQFDPLGIGGASGAGGASANPVRATVSAALNQSALPQGGQAVVAVVIEFKKGFHAQTAKPKTPDAIPTVVTAETTPAVAWSDPVYPAGHEEEYPGLGKLRVYSGKAVVYVPLKVAESAAPGATTLKGNVAVQICDDKGACFAPEDLPWTVKTEVVAKGTAVKPNAEDLFKDYTPGAKGAAPARGAGGTSDDGGAGAGGGAGAAGGQKAGPPPVAALNDSKINSFAGALGIAFLAGILFNIVPCVLPVLPIKVLGFAEVAEHHRAKTVALAGVFGLGIVTVFAVLAVVVLGFKSIGWGEQFSKPWFAWGVVAVFAVLAAWLFGWLNVNLPAGAYAFTPQHDTYFGNYLWGILTAVLSTPCTGPFFPPVLLWAGGQPTVLGVSAVMMVGVGMAFPYVVLSAFPEAARKFPRVGPWSELFKQMLGFLLLGSAVFFAAGRFTGAAGAWWATVPVMAIGGLYLMARTVQISKDAMPVAVSSTVAVLLVGATVLVAGRFSGWFDRAAGEAGPGRGGAEVAGVRWTPYSDQAFEAARQSGKIVLVKFTANWCLNCQLVEASVFHDSDALAALRKYDVVTLKADLTQPDAPGKQHLQRLNPAGGIPLTAVYAPGYEQPVKLTDVYKTATLTQTLAQLATAKTAAVR